jgi:hypothetical protein
LNFILDEIKLKKYLRIGKCNDTDEIWKTSTKYQTSKKEIRIIEKRMMKLMNIEL